MVVRHEHCGGWTKVWGLWMGVTTLDDKMSRVHKSMLIIVGFEERYPKLFILSSLILNLEKYPFMFLDTYGVT